MARSRSTHPAFEPTPVSLALKMRRIELGKSQADVAFDSGVLTQTTVSELERGKYGPEDLTAARLAALARGLDWSVRELEQTTGVDLGLDNHQAPPRPLRRLPAELQEMIDSKQILAPELATERWQQYLAGQRFSTGSASAERWWNLFLTLKNAGVEPGGN